MPDPVETTEPEGVDFGWVMQTTFVLTVLLGAPIVALVSIPVSLPTWGARAGFAIRVGAVVWIVVAIGAFGYARREAAREEGSKTNPTGSLRANEGLDTTPSRNGSNGDDRTEIKDRRRDRNDSDGGERGDESSPPGDVHSTPSASSETSSET